LSKREEIKEALREIIPYEEDAWHIDKVKTWGTFREVIFYVPCLTSSLLKKLIECSAVKEYPDISNGGRYGVRVFFAWTTEEEEEEEEKEEDEDEGEEE